MAKDPDPKEVESAAAEVYRDLKGCLPNEDPPKTPPKRDRPYKRKGRTSPVIQYVRSLGEGFQTAGEVALDLDVSSSYIRKISDETDLGVPSYKAKFGTYKIRVYTPEDVEKIRTYISSRFKLEKNDGTEDR